jgi:hypothetical protein
MIDPQLEALALWAKYSPRLEGKSRSERAVILSEFRQEFQALVLAAWKESDPELVNANPEMMQDLLRGIRFDDHIGDVNFRE